MTKEKLNTRIEAVKKLIFSLSPVLHFDKEAMQYACKAFQNQSDSKSTNPIKKIQQIVENV